MRTWWFYRRLKFEFEQSTKITKYRYALRKQKPTKCWLRERNTLQPGVTAAQGEIRGRTNGAGAKRWAYRKMSLFRLVEAEQRF